MYIYLKLMDSIDFICLRIDEFKFFTLQRCVDPTRTTSRRDSLLIKKKLIFELWKIRPQ